MYEGRSPAQGLLSLVALATSVNEATYSIERLRLEPVQNQSSSRPPFVAGTYSLTMFINTAAILTWGGQFSTVQALTHGRDAITGEFPFLMRIRIADIEDDASRLATGVLVKPTRVLTTCDSVGLFTGESINMHDLRRVTVMGGSVSTNGTDGMTKTPISSSHHPWCYLLASEVVLFNYGLFEVGDPFHIANSDRLQPVQQMFRNQEHMETATRYYIEANSDSYTCFSAGWGYPLKAFEDKVEPDNFEAASNILQVTTMKFTSYDRCQETSCIYFRDCFTSLWEYGLVCAVAPTGGPCRNDWGAPLICEGQVMGILAAAHRCADTPIPRHFARVDLAYEYIFGTGRGEYLYIKNCWLLLAVLLASKMV